MARKYKISHATGYFINKSIQKEMKVYVVNVNDIPLEKYHYELSNKDFMAIAIENDSVYTLKGFELEFNREGVCTYNDVIRILADEN